MRIMTLARLKAAILLAAVLALVPQFAFAQLPLQTQQLKLQGSVSGNTITLRSDTSTANYSLVYPATQGTVGAFLFLGSTDGTLRWSNVAGGDNYTPIWDQQANGGAGGIVWEDPNGAANPNWSRSGNAITSTGMLGSTTEQGFNIVTDSLVRIGLASDGAITINTTADGGATTTIGRAAGHTTNVDGTFDVDGTTDINVGQTSSTNINTGTATSTVTIGGTGTTIEQNASVWDINAATATIDATTSLGVTGTTNINTTGSAVTTIGNSGATNTVVGTTSITGATTINTTGTLGTTIGNSGSTTTILGATTINTSGTALTSIGNTGSGTDFTGPIMMAGDNGTSGEVLVSKGANATPEWQNLTESIGIRKVGVVSFSNEFQTNAISVANLAAGDAIIVTLQTTVPGPTVVATVTDRTDGASGSFKVTLSGRFNGAVNYMVIKALP